MCLLLNYNGMMIRIKCWPMILQNIPHYQESAPKDVLNSSKRYNLIRETASVADMLDNTPRNTIRLLIKISKSIYIYYTSIWSSS